MKFCPECGAKLVSQKFCAECGEDLRKYTGQGGEGAGGLGSFDFSALEREAKNQLLEQSGMQFEGSVLVKYTGKSRDMVIPKCVTEIYAEAFKNNQTIASVVIPDGVTSIGKGAFANCKYLQTVRIPATVVEIYNGAFLGCRELRDITLPENLTSIRDSVFSGCTSLTSIEIPNSVTSIGDSAFSSSSLTSIKIPNSVTRIGRDAFSCGKAIKPSTSLLAAGGKISFGREQKSLNIKEK